MAVGEVGSGEVAEEAADDAKGIGGSGEVVADVAAGDETTAFPPAGEVAADKAKEIGGPEEVVQQAPSVKRRCSVKQPKLNFGAKNSSSSSSSSTDS
jgi:hypothetical protein